MLQDYLIAPSITSLFVTGFLLLSIFILIINNFKLIINLKLYEKIILLCILSITIGTHGLIHLGVEKEYGYNPYNWI